jgi:hypothetical protein
MPQSSPPPYFRQEILDYTRSCERLIALATTADTPWSDRELQMIDGYIGELCQVFAPLRKNRAHSIVHTLARLQDPPRMSRSGPEGKTNQSREST